MTAAPATSYYIALGANLGDRAARLAWARERLSQLGPLVASPVYETAPVGRAGTAPPPQPDYLNQVVRLWTALPPEPLLDALLALEAEAGRVRDPQQQDAARTLDLDILLFGPDGSGVYNVPRLRIPHPRMHQRAFVLRPLLDLAPALQHPTLGCSLQGLLDALSQAPPARVADQRP